jgi:hypothetical protein
MVKKLYRTGEASKPSETGIVFFPTLPSRCISLAAGFPPDRSLDHRANPTSAGSSQVVAFVITDYQKTLKSTPRQLKNIAVEKGDRDG